MHFCSSIAIFALLAVSQQVAGAVTAVTSKKVVASITEITTISQSINIALTAVTTSTGVTGITSVSSTAVSGFQSIITNVGSAVTMLGGSGGVVAFDHSAQKAIVGVLLDFVKIHQALLATVIGKHAIFAQFFLTAPIAAVLRALEGVVDTFAVALIALIPDYKNTAHNGFMSLDASVSNSISTYDALCVPNILYPAFMPICISI